ncbi:cysteine desulfurase-like protein [Deinococcus ruber]|uniref:Cysteine desulfurase-like protein n=1 Tax=Deinococcus ruber TaxID=1848197 RepID=A0A918F6W3_9DEIO|nr:cysteine desulfurase-like protein [Deinococcus ruber]GGR14563.1 cysteine desulfurase-like protein [Deinococcus ruber]
MQLDAIRAQFPQLQNGLIYFDNAAGGLMPQRSIDAIREYLNGAGSANAMPTHRLGQAALALKHHARAATALFVNAEPGEVAMGPSATALAFRLSAAFGRLWGPGDEVIVSELEHEANASPWRELERVGVTLKLWHAQSDLTLNLDDLKALLTPRTKLLALSAASNAFGAKTPIREAAALARQAGAWTIVDAVHLASHELPDVRAWGVDFMTFSPYKVFAPHLGAMYVRRELLAGLPIPKLSFVPDDDITKLEHGTPPFELLSGWLGSLDYLRELGGADELSRAALEAAYRRIAELETPVTAQLLTGLQHNERVTLYGPARLEQRVGTFAFRVQGETPEQTALRLSERGVSVASGHFYAVLPAQKLGLYPEGVVRASLAHYTSAEDAQRLLDAL